jgi:CheY-like chemotaxis protein
MSDFSALLIDDDEQVQDLFRMVFEHYGRTLYVASDQDTALGVLAGMHPDVIVLDIFLPNTDGYRVLQSIRELYPQLRCPVVATTAYYTSDTEGDVLNHGFDGYLLKPLVPQTLMAYLEEVTRRP